MTTKFTPLSGIIERVYRTADYESIPWSDAAEDVLDCLRLIGVPNSYQDKTTNGQGENPVPIIVSDYRGELPYDMAVPGPCRLIQLDSNYQIMSFKVMEESQDLFYMSPTVREQYNTGISDSSSTLVATSMQLQMDEAQAEIDAGDLAGAEALLEDTISDVRQAQSRIVTSSTTNTDFFPRYKLNNDYIFTNFKNGFVEMSYKAYPVDEMGMPMVPDNIKFIKAVEWYLISRIDYKRWRTTRNPSDEKMWLYSDKEYLWYAQSARSAAHMPSLAMMESIKKMMLRSIPKINEFRNGFKNTPTQEQRKF
jgi:hypothetical protein